MARNEQVDDLLAEAQDANSTPERLAELWRVTKSTRVRKAIASNPNSDVKTMAMAARLYVKEVIANPSFELLNLFDEDKFVKMIYEAYEDPQELYKKTSLPNVKNTNDNRINLARALLVSPNLRSSNILQDICSTLNSAEFKRELKDPDVMKNVAKVAKSNLEIFRLSTLCFLLTNDVISVASFEKGLDLQKEPGSYWTSKGTYVKFVNNNMTGPNYPLLFKWLTVNRPGNIRDLIKSIRNDECYRTDTHMSIYSDLYRDLLYFDVIRNRAVSKEKRRQYGWYNGRGYLNDEDFSYHLSDLIWTAIACRTNMAKGVDNLDLEVIFDDIKRVGFDKDFGPHKCELNLNPYGSTITGRTMMCEKLLSLKSDEAFEFFVTSGLVWDEWYGKWGVDNAETRVVERLNRINRDKFSNNKPLLYNRTDLDSFPTIKVVRRRGYEYGPDMYKLTEPDNSPPLLVAPPPSGRIPVNVLYDMAVKGIK